jgi:hypothetical protein
MIHSYSQDTGVRPALFRSDHIGRCTPDRQKEPFDPTVVRLAYMKFLLACVCNSTTAYVDVRFPVFGTVPVSVVHSTSSYTLTRDLTLT